MVRFILVVLALGVASEPAGAATVVLKAARMFDARKQTLVRPGLVVVTDGVIGAVGGAPPAQADETIDLGDATLLPGFLDAHVHLAFQASGDWEHDWVEEQRQPIAEQALHASVYARRTLEAGFTTVRNIGAQDFIDAGLRDAIAKGSIPGPTMLVGLESVGTTGGHCDIAGPREGLLAVGRSPAVADGPDGLRAAVRRNIKFGADVIKVCATGGVLSLADDVQAPQLTQAELDAVVDEAHARGRKVAVHAHGAEGAKRAVRAGADSIEHGTFLDDAALSLMKKRGTYFVPTLMAYEGVKRRLEAGGLPPPVIPKARAAVASVGTVIKRAIQMKLKIALGTDSGVTPHGKNADEIVLLVQSGMTPAEALATATLHTAELIGTLDRGVLEVGKRADVIAVAGDPIADIGAVRTVRLVMQGGAVVRR